MAYRDREKAVRIRAYPLPDRLLLVYNQILNTLSVKMSTESIALK